MKLNKKYFLAILTTISLQFILGINSSYAVPCEDKVDTEFNYNGTYAAPVGKVWEYLWGNTHAKYTSVEDAKNKLYDTAVRYIDNRYEGNRQECVKNVQYETNGGIELIACMNQVLANNGCDPSVFKRDGTSPRSNSSNSKSNNSSSSGSSSQSSKKANQQATNNQSNQNTSNKPQPDPMGEMGDILGGVTASTSSSNLSMKPEQAAIVNEASQTYATKTAAFEESHKGLKRTHNKEDEASRCLVIENRKIKNTCDFRVEYTFCAYKPNLKAFSAAFEMAAAFDCEQRKFGSAGISAKRVDAGTFTAEAVYVFGCKDPSRSRDVTYERGRGLSGRCSE